MFHHIIKILGYISEANINAHGTEADAKMTDAGNNLTELK